MEGMQHSETDQRGRTDLEAAREAIERLGRRARAVIIGRDEVIELTLIALVADGHVLLEDYPGSGKTTLAHLTKLSKQARLNSSGKSS